MRITEFEYPQITGVRAALESFLNDRLPECALPIHGRVYHPALADQNHKTTKPSINLRCVLAAHPVVVQLETQAMEKCLPEDLSIDDFNRLPEDLQLAALQIVLDDAFSEISEKLNDDCGLQAIVPAKEAAGEHAIAFNLIASDSIVPGVLRLSGDAMAWFAELCVQHGGNGKKASPPNDLPIPLRLELAQTALTESQLHSLEKDDIVLFPADGWPEEQLRVRAGQACFSARLDEEGGLSIHEKLSMTDDEDFAGEERKDRGEEQDDEQGRSEGGTGNKTLFAVRFEFPPQKIELGDLRRLRSGRRIAIAPCTSDSVLAYVGDRAIARCELVRVQNHRGARIVSAAREEKTDVQEGAAGS